MLLDEFIVNVSKGPKLRRFVRVTAEEHPCGAQLMGAEPRQFAAAALRLVAAGFDVIDLNFGCPVRKVLGRCRGGFLLSVPATALEIVSRVRDAVPEPIPVTVKMRRGMDDSAASREAFFSQSSTGPSPAASRRPPCMAERCGSAISAPAPGSSWPK